MEEQVQKSNAGKILGIIAFVIAIVGIVISFIPCLGMYGLAPCGIAIILAVIAFVQAKNANSPKGLIIAALIISVVGTGLAAWQMTVWMNAKSEIETSINALNELNNIDTKSLEDELNDAMNQSLDSLGGAVDQMQQGLDSVSGK